MVTWISPDPKNVRWQVAVTTSAEGNMSFRYDPEKVVHERRSSLCQELQMSPSEVLALSLDLSHGVHWLDHVPTGYDFFEAQGFRSEGIWLPSGTLIPFLVVADCYPLAFLHPSTGRIGVFHAGRAELQTGLLEKFLRLAVDHGITMGEIHCFIGPGICTQHYLFDRRPEEIGERYITKIDRQHGINLIKKIQDTFFDFGITTNHIFSDNRCSFEADELFSHRRSNGKNEKRFALVTRLM